MSKREDIILAALHIISDSGLNGLTLPVLFEQAKTGPGTFYHYFENTGDLVTNVFEYCTGVAYEELVLYDNPEHDPHLRYYEFCKNIYRAYRDHPLELDFLYGYSFGYTVRYDKEAEVPTIPSLNVLKSIITEAQRRKCVSTAHSALTISHVVRGMIASYYWASIYDSYTMGEEEAIAFAEMTWNAMCVCDVWNASSGEMTLPCMNKECLGCV